MRVNMNPETQLCAWKKTLFKKTKRIIFIRFKKYLNSHKKDTKIQSKFVRQNFNKFLQTIRRK
jgi:hypothetical protein